MSRLLQTAILTLCLGLVSPGAWAMDQAVPAGDGPIMVITLADTINPGSVELLRRALAEADNLRAVAVVVQLDTPGGVVDSMRDMVQQIMQAPRPVIVYVAPAGARATSAGAFLVLAGSVAAMAPATHLGAAAPVAAGGQEIEGTMAKKAQSDLVALITSLAKRRGRDPEAAALMVSEAKSYDAGKAKELGLVDEIAPDLGSLLKALDGREVQTGAGRLTIVTTGRNLAFYEPGWRERLLSALANPNLAYILLMVGLAGLYFELSTPGAVLPGVVGALSLILAVFAMSALPISYAGLALILLAAVLFIAEIKVTSYGLLSVGGAVSLILGSIMLFETDETLPGLSWRIVGPTMLITVAFFAGVAYLAGRAQLARTATGSEGLVGKVGRVLPGGKIKVGGEIWSLANPGRHAVGQEVEITGSQGLLVEVRNHPRDGQNLD